MAKTTNIGKNNANQPTIVVNSTDGIIAFGGQLTTAGGGTNALQIISNVDMRTSGNRLDVGTIYADSYLNLPEPSMPSDKRLKNITGLIMR